jgi:hypothetical protein
MDRILALKNKNKTKKIKDINILKWTAFEVLMVVTIQKIHTRFRVCRSVHLQTFK